MFKTYVKNSNISYGEEVWLAMDCMTVIVDTIVQIVRSNMGRKNS
jgi:hypothetical protein